VFRLDLVAQFCHDQRRLSPGPAPQCPPAIRLLVFVGGVTYDLKRVVEIGLLHPHGDPAPDPYRIYAGALRHENLLAEAIRSRFCVGAGATWALWRLYVN